MDFKYNISYINPKDRWIFIKSNDEFDLYEPDAFVNFVEKIQKDTGGTIENVGHIQYILKNDTPRFIYQWDDLFGIVVIYPENMDEKEAVQFLCKYMSEF